MMKSPVIIPAHNEAASIHKILIVLPQDCLPIVAVNGSTDATADIARGFGAEVHIFEEPGKDAAFRGTLRALGTRALEPFAITDADTVPFKPKRWLDTLISPLAGLSDGSPGAVSGLVGYRPEWASFPADPRTLRQTYLSWGRQKGLQTKGAYCPSGANAAFRLTEQVLEALLGNTQLYWPGEDQYYFDLVRESGGSVVQLTGTDSAIFASSRYHVGFMKRLINGRAGGARLAEENYAARGKLQPGTIEYRSDLYPFEPQLLAPPIH